MADRLFDHYIRLKEDVEKAAFECGRNPDEITIVAASKTCTAEEILEVYRAGCRVFGENRVQEALQKIPICPKDIQWHMIGTLQANKINKAVGNFSLIETVDSYEAAIKISNASQRLGLVVPVFLQVNTSREISKHGLDPENWRRCLDGLRELCNIKIEGLMTVGPVASHDSRVRSCFIELRKLRDEFKQRISETGFCKELSMGMSGDYKIAIQEGATVLRIGTAIFGERS